MNLTAQHDSMYVVLTLDSNKVSELQSNSPADLSSEEIATLDVLLKNFMVDQEKSFKKLLKKRKKRYPHTDEKETLLKDIDQYRRQYVASSNAAGEKVVWVNCVCDPYGTGWRNGIVMVFDGGNCFFNVMVNLSKRKVYNLYINGEA